MKISEKNKLLLARAVGVSAIVVTVGVAFKLYADESKRLRRARR